MSTDHRARLADIRRFNQLVAYLRDEMGWPIESNDFEELTFEYTPEELGIDSKNAAAIQEIKRLRPLTPNQPWGIFFVKFEPKRLPVLALRRILGQVALKKRASANKSERQAWAADDLLFVSNYGEGEERQIVFAHFSQPTQRNDLPTLKVLGWDNRDTTLHLDAIAKELTQNLAWPADEEDIEVWRQRWRAAFTLRHREVITTSKQLSIRLAELARVTRELIRSALAIETEHGPLTKLMKAFQEALLHDLDAEDFADMYAQTIAYGLLSARIADPHRKTADDFAGHMRTNPFLRELMETFLRIGGRKSNGDGSGIDFDELGISEVVELLDHANMEAVIRDFGDRNPQEDPVIHFYELFLKEYDAKKRMQRGVFYTPRPVVSYIVRSVDGLLRTEFGLKDGLADTSSWAEMTRRYKDLEIPEGIPPEQHFLQILDPACGTGTFLVEAIDLIYRRMVETWSSQGHSEQKIEALWNDYVPRHLLTRLHGYELLMAPYAIAHVKIGLKLYETGYRFGSDERARVFLTNALEPPTDVQFRITALPALAHEAQAVNEIKRKQRFTVVMGNPPYSGHAKNKGAWIQSLMRGKLPDGANGYFEVDGAPLGERNPKWVNDDYVQFIRLSQAVLVGSGVGVFGVITAHGYLENPTFRGMRQSLTRSFRKIAVIDLNGNAKRGSTGDIDENVFEIQQGVAIALMRRVPTLPVPLLVEHQSVTGSRQWKYEYLSRSAPRFSTVRPMSPFYLFIPQTAGRAAEYEAAVSLKELMPYSNTGMITSRDAFVIGFSKNEVAGRLDDFSSRPIAESRKKYDLVDVREMNLEESRRLLRGMQDRDSHIHSITYRPFDIRHVFYHHALVRWPVYDLMNHLLRRGNRAIGTVRRAEIAEGWSHVFCVGGLAQHHTVSIKEVNYFLPLYVYPEGLFHIEGSAAGEGNLSAGVIKRFKSATGLVWDATKRSTTTTTFSPEDVFDYVYAQLHSLEYRDRYSEQLKLDWPRVFIPSDAALFKSLARLGGELVALHLMESPKLDRFITTYTGPKNPEAERVGWLDDTVWLDAAATKKGQPATPGTIGFRGVPEAVWNFHIGGYQVCKKWLKDRKGRTLSKDDIAHYQKIVVSLNETIRLMKEIDDVIERHGGWPGAFQTAAEKSAQDELPARVIPFRPRVVEPRPEERYVTCVPLVPLKVAAGAFGDPQHIEDDAWEWVVVETRHRLRPGMFVAQVVGKSMEPVIPNGSYCLFRAPIEGTRQGKTVLVRLRDATDSETGERYTVKRYESEKAADGDSWRHATITLKPVNPDFEPIVLTGAEEGQLQVVAELVEVLGEGLKSQPVSS